MVSVIEVRNLVKHFGAVKAVNGVSFQIGQGRCFGLLGPNGAGKTTTIEIIEGITPMTSGEVLFKGAPVGRDFREKSGIQFQHTALQDFLTVRESLRLFQSFYSTSADLKNLIRLCALEEFLDRDIHKISGGQRQRVLLAIALVNDPEVVFLDEPTTGLDPQARRNFWDLIQSIKAQGKTVVLTTHYMEEAYTLCDEIAIMDRGIIIAQGEPDNLLKQHFEGVTIGLPAEEMGEVVERLPWKSVNRNGVIEFRTTQVNEALKFLLDAGASLTHLKVRSQTLEDLFLELTGKDIRV